MLYEGVFGFRFLDWYMEDFRIVLCLFVVWGGGYFLKGLELF